MKKGITKRITPHGMPAPAPLQVSGFKSQRSSVSCGLGDLIERAARPIAQRIDRLTARLPKRYRTKLAGCSACSRRRKWLNKLVPNVRSLRAWLRPFRFLLSSFPHFNSEHRPHS